MAEINRTTGHQEGNRQVAIEVRGSRGTNKRRYGNYTLIVPYSRLSQTIQRLHQRGGRILNITVDSGPLLGVKIATPATKPAASPPPPLVTVKPEPVTTEFPRRGTARDTVPTFPTTSKGRLHRRSRLHKSRLAKTFRGKRGEQKRQRSKSYCLG
jgi:hypothetical protein